MKLLKNFLHHRVSSAVSAQRIAGDDNHVGLFVVENIEHPPLPRSHAMRMQIAELRDFERRRDFSLHRSMNDFDAERLDPQRIREEEHQRRQHERRNDAFPVVSRRSFANGPSDCASRHHFFDRFSVKQ